MREYAIFTVSLVLFSYYVVCNLERNFKRTK
jgi:hypothetical protein